MMSCRKIMTSFLCFGFMASLELSASRILDAQSVKLIFSLKGSFYLTKIENSHTITLSKITIFDKKCQFFAKKANISKIKKALVPEGIFSEAS